MKSKFNHFISPSHNIFVVLSHYNTIYTTQRSLLRQNRSKLVDSPTIYHSISIEEVLGAQNER